MKVLLKTLIIISFFVLVPSVKASNNINIDLPQYSKTYDDQRNPFNDAIDALALAKNSNRQVLIEIGGNWCSWCHKMDVFLNSNPEVYQALHSNYVLLKVNVSDTNENEAFMKGLPPVLGYPHMYISNAEGKTLLSKDTAELLSDDNYSKAYWLAFLDKWTQKNSKKSLEITTKTTQSIEGK